MLAVIARSLPKMGPAFARSMSQAPIKTSMWLTIKQANACFPRLLKNGGSINFPPGSLKDKNTWLHEHFREFDGQLDIRIKLEGCKQTSTITNPSLKEIPYPGTEGTLLKDVKVADLGLSLTHRLAALSRSHYGITISKKPAANPPAPSTSLRRRCTREIDV